MLKKKQLIVIIILAVIFLVFLLSWNVFRENSLPINATSLDLSAQVSIEAKEPASDNVLAMQFEWQTGPEWAPITGHPAIFVHLQDEDGERICQDDHIPEPAISSWQANQVYRYERLMYIPITLIKKKVTLLIGIYDQVQPDIYYALKGLPVYNRYHRYLAQEFVLNPSNLEYSEALLKYTNGWYDPELDARGNIKWRWMKKLGECKLVNVKKDALLYLDLWVPNEHLASPAVVTVKLAGQPLDLTVNPQGYIQQTVEITAAQMGDEDYIVLQFETDQTFIPAQKGDSIDVRELGLMVRKVLFRAK